MPRKRQKMYWSDIFQLESSYSGFRDVKYKGIRGCEFYFYSITERELEFIKSFKNTVIIGQHYKYAPEQKRIAVLVLDKIPK